jgi:inner membrane protein
VGLAAARVKRPPEGVSSRAWTFLLVALSFLPDADVVAFRFGIPYGAPLGHRGASHSLAFAGAVAVLLAVLAARNKAPVAALALTGGLVLATHGLLDTLTDGGRGVALLWPFGVERYFAPWRPIPVAPIGAGILAPHGLRVMAHEAVLFLPLWILAAWPSVLKPIALWADVWFCLATVAVAATLRPRTWIWWAGLALAAAAIPPWIAARRQLGPAFSFRARAGTLVTRGLYAKIRHPIYLFGCLAYMGALLALQVWPLLVFWLALTPIELIRVRREERALEARFGEEYRLYRSGTWF